MRGRHIVTIACVALGILAASAGADELGPPEPVALDPVAAGPAEALAPTATATPAAPPAPIPTAVPEATPEATQAPTPTVVVEETPAVEATPAATPTAVAEPARAAEATPTPTVMATPMGPVTAAEQATRARTVTVAVTAQATPPPEPAQSGCATPVEPLEGVPGVTETPSVDGVCRVSAAVCSILGTDGDDVLTGSPFDDILCGLGGNDRLDGGDGDDVLLGGEGNDELVGGAGEDCVVGGPGADRADWGKWIPGGTVETDQGVFEYDPFPIGPGLEDTVEIDDTITDLRTGDPITTGEVGVTFDDEGRCTGAVWSITYVLPVTLSPRPEDAHAPSASAPAASTSGPDGLRFGLPDGRLAVRNDMVRVPVSCSAEAAAELVLLSGSQRIARKRFTCTPPDEKVRVRLNDAGRKLVADDDRVLARLLVLAAGRTVSRQVLLVSPAG